MFNMPVQDTIISQDIGSSDQNLIHLYGEFVGRFRALPSMIYETCVSGPFPCSTRV